MPSNYANLVLSQSPTHFWACTESSGTLADQGSTAHGATPSNLTYGQTGPPGGDTALLWDGTGTEQISTNSGTSYPDGSTAAWTLSLWANPTNRTTLRTLASRTAGGATGWAWWLDQTTGKPTWGKDTVKNQQGTTGPATATWSHLAVVVTLAGGTFTIAHYLNGAANGGGTVAKGSDFTAASTTTLIWGYFSINPAIPFLGSLTGLGIWTGTALTGAQILDQYNAGATAGAGPRSRAYVIG